MNIIVPAPLVKDITALEEAILKVGKFSRKIQIDVVDGKFAPVETVTPEMLLSIETTADIEVHLMVEEPIEWLQRCVTAGVTSVVGHIEKMSDVQAFVAESEAAGLKTGLALNINTPVFEIEEWVNLVDSVLLMSVPAGAQGQKFDDRVLEKIKKVREMSDYVTILVDGGLNEENIKKCLEVGGEKMEFDVGSEILNSEYPEESFRKLENVE